MPRDADILAGLSDEQILAEMRAGNRAVTEAWERRHEERMRAVIEAGYAAERERTRKFLEEWRNVRGN